MVRPRARRTQPAPSRSSPRRRYARNHTREIEQTEDQTFPPALTALHKLEFDYDEGIDFEPYDKFFPAHESASWFRAWTGNARRGVPGLRTGRQWRLRGHLGRA
jgi:hypothetical protein